MFGNLKTKGFNLEDTHPANADRLSTLLAKLALAVVLAVETGVAAARLGLDICFSVSNFDRGAAKWLYDSRYCARRQVENLIKLPKTQLASYRTSCRSAIANQVRLVLRTAAIG